MPYQIRPMSFGEILDTGFQIVRDHFLLLVGIGAVAYVPLGLVQALFTPFVRPTSTTPSLPGALGVLGIAVLTLALFPIVVAAETFALGEVYLGRATTVGGAYRESFKIFAPLLGTLALYSLAIAGGFILLVIPGLYLMAAFLLVNQVIVLERVFGTHALRRSRELMRGNLWRGIGIVVVVWALQMALAFGVGLAFGFLPLVRDLARGVVSAVAFSYLSAVSVVLYFDIRCRKEAFELEHLARLVEQRAETTAPATA